MKATTYIKKEAFLQHCLAGFVRDGKAALLTLTKAEEQQQQHLYTEDTDHMHIDPPTKSQQQQPEVITQPLPVSETVHDEEEPVAGVEERPTEPRRSARISTKEKDKETEKRDSTKIDGTPPKQKPAKKHATGASSTALLTSAVPSSPCSPFKDFEQSHN